MAGRSMPGVEVLCIRAVQPPHPDAEVRFAGLEQEVDVVVHQAIGQEAPAKVPDRASQDSEVRPSIVIVAIYESLVVAAREDVKQAGLDLCARLAWHVRRSGIEHDSTPHSLKGQSLYAGARPPLEPVPGAPGARGGRSPRRWGRAGSRPPSHSAVRPPVSRPWPAGATRPTPGRPRTPR